MLHLLLLSVFPLLAEAGSLSNEFYIDSRFTTSTGEPGWLDGGLGKSRFGGDVDGESNDHFHLAELAILTQWEVSWDLKGFLHLQYDPGQTVKEDVIEGYFIYQPVPQSDFTFRFKTGLFFPSISRENTGPAWSSPYTISSSAINSWVGEEIRVVGFEFKIIREGEMGNLAISASAFGFNDPTGTLLAYRGWSIGDVKAGARSQLPLAELPAIGLDSSFVPQPYWVDPVKEVDNKIGYYFALDWKSHQPIEIGFLYYNNRGDPDVVEDYQYAWGTEFFNFYIEIELPKKVTVISQYSLGSTIMGGQIAGTQTWDVDVDYSAGFILGSKKAGRYRVSVRYDWFDTDDNSHVLIDNNNENGSAVTFAVSMQLRKKDLLIAEYLIIDSYHPARTTIGYLAQQETKAFQMSYRFFR